MKFSRFSRLASAFFTFVNLSVAMTSGTRLSLHGWVEVISTAHQQNKVQEKHQDRVHDRTVGENQLTGGLQLRLPLTF